VGGARMHWWPCGTVTGTALTLPAHGLPPCQLKRMNYDDDPDGQWTADYLRSLLRELGPAGAMRQYTGPLRATVPTIPADLSETFGVRCDGAAGADVAMDFDDVATDVAAAGDDVSSDALAAAETQRTQRWVGVCVAACAAPGC